MSRGPIVLEDLPGHVAEAATRLRDDLLAILGDDLIALWLYGGTTFADRSAHGGDLDVCAVVARVAPGERVPHTWRRDPQSRPGRIAAAELALEGEFGMSVDGTYFLVDDVSGDAPPPDAFKRSHRDQSWPIYRAHWLAGQYVLLHGRRPDELIVAPSPAAMRRALDREVEHLERHVAEGDAADPGEAAYATLNGCRILCTLTTGNPALSKRSAGAWAVEHLAPRWHDAIRAAQRWYEGTFTPPDAAMLRDAMPAFVAFVRERLPAHRGRTRRRPRWT